MKLAGAAAAARFCARPDPGRVGALLYGPEAGLIDHHRRLLVAAVAGGDDLRLSRIDAAEARRDGAAVGDALRARGFFPGRRVVLVEGAKDGLAAALGEAVAGLAPDDGFLVVTAEGVTTKSPLVKLFEGRGDLVAIGLYAEAPDGAALAAQLRMGGCACGLTADAEAALAAAAGDLDLGEIAQLIEKIAIFSAGTEAPLEAQALVALLPQVPGGEVDALVAAVAEGRVPAVGPMMARLETGGVTPAAMIIAVGRHFRQLAALSAAPDGVEAALGRMRPPAWGPRGRALGAQARRWQGGMVETAVRLIFAADRALRSPGTRPDRAMVERCLIRLAMMAGRP